MSHQEENNNDNNSDAVSDDFVLEAQLLEDASNCSSCCKNTQLIAVQMREMREQLDAIQAENKVLRGLHEKQSELYAQNGEIHAINCELDDKLRLKPAEKLKLEANSTGKEDAAKGMNKFTDAIATMYGPLLGTTGTIRIGGIGTQANNSTNESDNIKQQLDVITKILAHLMEHHNKGICLASFTNAVNHWDKENCGVDAALTADGLTVVKLDATQTYTNVRSKEPFSFPTASVTSENAEGCCASTAIRYFELFVKNMMEKGLCIGLVCPDFDPTVGSKDFLEQPISYGIGSHGAFTELKQINEKCGEGFEEGDTLGCGLMRLVNGRLKLFFTKNGQLYGKPLVLPSSIHLPLFPCVTLLNKGMTVQANFGTDPTKPYMFNLQHC